MVHSKNLLTAFVLTAGISTMICAETKKTTVARKEASSEISLGQALENSDLRVRVVNTEEALHATPQGQKVTKELEARRMELAKDIQAKQEKLASAANEFQAKKSTMKPDSLETEQKKLVNLERDYKDTLQEAEAKMQREMQEKTKVLYDEYKVVVAEVAKQDGIDIVFGPEGILYTSDKADYTSKVQNAMTKNHSVKVAQAEKNAKTPHKRA